MGIIREDYITICPINASAKTVEKIAESISTTILQEENLKSLGIDIDSILSDLK